MNLLSTKPVGVLLACVLSMMPAVASANTLERVRASNTLTLGYLPDFAPFSSHLGDKASGYAIDLCLKIADKVKAELGLPSLQVRFEAIKVAEEVSAVSSGKVDIFCTPTPANLERRKTVSFSVPVYTAGLSAVVHKDSPETLLKVLNGEVAHDGPTWRATVNRGLTRQTLAVPAGGVTEQWIREQMRLLGVIATLVTVRSNDEGIKLVAEGKADAFFSDRIVLKNHIAKDYPDGNLMVLDRIYEYAPASMMVERGDEDFRLLVDTVLSDMYRSGEIEQAYAKYLGGASDTAKKLFDVYALP
ncbi:amino acid ABC transporter substrate-binding protein [Pseudomonas fluorescens]|uniref:amino acid ABC transporter substrate-binding protein n=1 Tax=Pseudomonas fluorescens TaxID=294 RepID=UPI0012413CC0|nr:amino acid ABC transporter substrate-binding protein [Pseudomonas fluorescens]VVN29298.1 Glutamate/aspartate import solute-binding protein [Pseudomonas fluorescens]